MALNLNTQDFYNNYNAGVSRIGTKPFGMNVTGGSKGAGTQHVKPGFDYRNLDKFDKKPQTDSFVSTTSNPIQGLNAWASGENLLSTEDAEAKNANIAEQLEAYNFDNFDSDFSSNPIDTNNIANAQIQNGFGDGELHPQFYHDGKLNLFH